MTTRLLLAAAREGPGCPEAVDRAAGLGHDLGNSEGEIDGLKPQS